MKQNWLLQKIETSQAFRLILEILIAFITLLWLPLFWQIIMGIILSVICEIFFAQMMTKSLKNKLSHQSLTQVFHKLEEK